MPRLHERLQRRGDAPAVGPAERVVGNQHATGSAHGHLSAQDFLVLIAAHRHYRDVSTGAGGNLQCLFNRIIVRLVDRIDQVVALDIGSGAVELDFVFRSVRHSLCANQDLHLPFLLTLGLN